MGHDNRKDPDPPSLVCGCRDELHMFTLYTTYPVLRTTACGYIDELSILTTYTCTVCRTQAVV